MVPPAATRTQSDALRAQSTREERHSSASLSGGGNDSNSHAAQAVQPLSSDKIASANSNTQSDVKHDTTSHAATRLKALSVPSKALGRSDTENAASNRTIVVAPNQASSKEPKLLTVARALMRNPLSPRPRAATTDAVPSSTTSTAAAVNGASSQSTTASDKPAFTTGFGKFRRAITSTKGEWIKDTTKAEALLASQQSERQRITNPTPALLSAKQRSALRVSAAQPPGDSDDAFSGADATKSVQVHALDLGQSEHDDDSHETSRSHPPTEHASHSLVDDVCTTLDRLVTQLDSVDVKKLHAIRLGGELRGLLGKAQDEFYAYESAFVEHASQVGVAIALQNFAASLQQVFETIARLQTTKALFLLNKKFKREVLFAFQEINSYYTSLFMELAMAVAMRSGIVLPLPSPVKPEPPPSVVVEEEKEECLPTPPPPPALPTADMLCLEAHQFFYGHRRAKDYAKALDLYKLAAELESVEASASLGAMYAEGISVEKDLLVAETWLIEAASGGSIDACYSLGRILCERARHQTQNEVKQRETYDLAMVRFAHAAAHGHSSAQYELGVLYENGFAGTCDEPQAIEWYKRAAAQGHTDAEASLGRLFYASDGHVERDITQAIHFFQRAASKNDASSQRCLGRVFAKGDGVKVDLERAIAFYRKAAESGNCLAMFELAQLLLAPETAVHESSAATVRFGDREDVHDEALRLLLNAGARGIVDAFFALGELLEHSKFLRDKAAALRFYKKAANATPSHPKAAKRAAAMHYAGIGTTPDKWKAHRLYAIAANGGDAEALNALGLMYEEGEGCDVDFKQAATCYRHAVELRNPHAHFNLACLLSQGKGVARNQDAAQMHYQKALGLGYALARDFITPPTE